MDLFDLNHNEYDAKPLADKMRPNNLDEFIGQKHIVAEGSLLRRAIRLDRLGSCIFWGPPGCGKTTLANIIAATTHGNFVKLNAVQSGVADVKKAVEDARNSLKLYGKRRIFFWTNVIDSTRRNRILYCLRSSRERLFLSDRRRKIRLRP